MEPLAPGTVLAGRYRLDVKLGEGGMGMVWAATHVVTRQPVALKLLLRVIGDDGPRIIKRFMREARAASAVKHPNVVVVYDVMELDAETPMMVMELLHGETLGERLHRERRLPIGELARALLPVVSALGTAHALGVVHRDIKPDNIFLANTPEGVCVKVLDFGIAKLSPMHEDATSNTATLTATNAIVGTPQYMAPEQVFGEKDIDHRADVWALGVIAYECIAGSRPTEASNVGQVMKIIATRSIVPIQQVVPDVQADVASIVMAALSTEREQRPSLHDMMTVLARYSDVNVRAFAEPQAPITLSSGVSLPPNDSGQHGARTDPNLGTAPTVVSDERVPTSPTAATLMAGVTQVDATPPVAARKPSRWLTLALALIAVAATSALTVSLVSRPRSQFTPPASPTMTLSVTPAASVTASVAKQPEANTADAAASVAATATTTTTTHAPHATASASAPAIAPTKRPEHGGVVETVPY